MSDSASSISRVGYMGKKVQDNSESLLYFWFSMIQNYYKTGVANKKYVKRMIVLSFAAPLPTNNIFHFQKNIETSWAKVSTSLSRYVI